MAEDPLAKWRKPGIAPLEPREQAGARPVDPPKLVKDSGPAPEETDDEKSPTRYRLHVLELRPLRGFTSCPAYADYQDMLFDESTFTVIVLVFRRLLVVIRGRNLVSIVAGLRMRTQWVIEEHDPGKETPAKNAPVVESMEFFDGDPTEKLMELRNMLRRGEASRIQA